MKKTIAFAVVVVVAALISTAATSHAREKTISGGGATLHMISSTIPGSVQVTKAYRGSITLRKLKSTDTAYWNPHGGKYIIDGDYSYLWSAVFKKGRKNPSHYWIAIQTDALHRALDIGNSYSDGIAFYQLNYDDGVIFLKAYPYSTLHAMARGYKVISVKQ
jgi:hypothetical protein